MFTYTSHSLYQTVVGPLGIAPAADGDVQLKSQTVARVVDDIKNGKHTFAKLPDTNDYIDTCKQVLEKLAWAKRLVVVGIGGSDLGARAVQQAVAAANPTIKVTFAGDTTDPHAIDALLADVDFGTTVFNIVSKSGSTMEPLAWYVYLKSILKSHSETNWFKHFVFTTDHTHGILNEEIRREGDKIEKLILPEDVGGRFSVLSSVGILPALALGVDARQMLAGASTVVKDFLAAGEFSPAAKIAWEHYLLHQQNKRVHVLWAYSTRLSEFTRWWRQLWAESLGKNGKGIFPIASLGPADQHSQLQLYNEGSPVSAHTILKIRQHNSSHIIKNVDIPELNYLQGRDFGEIINLQADATYKTLTNHGHPAALLEIDQLNAYSLGELFMTFEIAVVVLGGLLQINAFDQPGVEESKQLIKQSLGVVEVKS